MRTITFNGTTFVAVNVASIFKHLQEILDHLSNGHTVVADYKGKTVLELRNIKGTFTTPSTDTTSNAQQDTIRPTAMRSKSLPNDNQTDVGKQPEFGEGYTHEQQAVMKKERERLALMSNGRSNDNPYRYSVKASAIHQECTL